MAPLLMILIPSAGSRQTHGRSGMVKPSIQHACPMKLSMKPFAQHMASFEDSARFSTRPSPSPTTRSRPRLRLTIGIESDSITFAHSWAVTTRCGKLIRTCAHSLAPSGARNASALTCGIASIPRQTKDQHGDHAKLGLRLIVVTSSCQQTPMTRSRTSLQVKRHVVEHSVPKASST